MSELGKAKEELNRILDLIPISGSFESARLANEAAKLAKRINELASQPNQKSEPALAASSGQKH